MCADQSRNEVSQTLYNKHKQRVCVISNLAWAMVYDGIKSYDCDCMNLILRMEYMGFWPFCMLWPIIVNTLRPEQNGHHLAHDDVIKWLHFHCHCPFVQWIHRSPVNSLHKGQWRGAVMFSLTCASINGWVNNHEAGDLRRHCAHYDVTVMRHCIFLFPSVSVTLRV